MITCSISARAQNANFHEKVYWCENTIDAHARVRFSARDEKDDSDYMHFSARLAGLKILARFEDTGLGFLARAELHPALNCAWAELLPGTKTTPENNDMIG